MTAYACRCGLAHDSSEQAPCPETFTLPVERGWFWLSRVERMLIICALRARHSDEPRMPEVVELIHKLGTTREEAEADAAFARAQAARFGRGDAT